MDLENIISDIIFLFENDPGEFIFLLVLWSVIIFLVLFVTIKIIMYVVGRNKEVNSETADASTLSKKTDSKKTSFDVYVHVKGTEKEDDKDVVLEKTNQITMYSFNFSKTSKLCPNCDGENELEEKHCHICGSGLN